VALGSKASEDYKIHFDLSGVKLDWVPGTSYTFNYSFVYTFRVRVTVWGEPGKKNQKRKNDGIIICKTVRREMKMIFA